MRGTGAGPIVPQRVLKVTGDLVYDRESAGHAPVRAVVVRPPSFLGSSMAEHPAVNRRVAGSSPARGAKSLTVNKFQGRVSLGDHPACGLYAYRSKCSLHKGLARFVSVEPKLCEQFRNAGIGESVTSRRCRLTRDVPGFSSAPLPGLPLAAWRSWECGRDRTCARGPIRHVPVATSSTSSSHGQAPSRYDC